MAGVAGVVFDLGNVLVDWVPHAAIAAGVGPEEATRFLAADDFDFRAFNHGPDSGGSWADAEAEVRRTHPHWLDHALSYRTHFAASLVGEVPGSVAILRDLHSAGVRVWALTNWSEDLWPVALQVYDFLELFEEVLVSGIEGVAKPDPAVWDLLAVRTGLTLDSLVFIDDRADNVASAAAAGLDALVFTDADRLRTDLRERDLPV